MVAMTLTTTLEDGEPGLDIYQVNVHAGVGRTEVVVVSVTGTVSGCGAGCVGWGWRLSSSGLCVLQWADRSKHSVDSGLEGGAHMIYLNCALAEQVLEACEALL